MTSSGNTGNYGKDPSKQSFGVPQLCAVSQLVWRTTIVKSLVGQADPACQSERNLLSAGAFSTILVDELLEKVNRPGQYLGNEWGAAKRNWDSAQVRLALVFPDLYELGMSNFGLRILYHIVNALPDFLCDRSYAPDSDMERLLKERNLPLWGWESRRPLSAFDLLGFSLQYELTYTNVLNLIQLSGIAVRASERNAESPLIFGGGPSAVNPEPLAAFMDFFVIGDGEQALPSVLEVVKAHKQKGMNSSDSRRELLMDLAIQVPGVYVPSLYETNSGPVAKPVAMGSRRPPERVARQVQPLTCANQPTGGLVPYLSLVHDRQVLEVRRGCDRGCRFCQPGYTFLPVRERSAEDLLRLSREALANSGHQEYSMLSLCVSDYTSLHEAVRELNSEHSARRASMSFPSQRADRMNLDLAAELKAVRKSGITLAPEAGTERLRAVINKGLNHGQIISAIEAAYKSGWSAVKLYFMLGLPTETDDDLRGIINILKEATELCRQIRRAQPETFKRALETTCTISNFVPKPFTPFQWFGQITVAETLRRQKVLSDSLKAAGLKNVTLNFTSPQMSLLEAVISRGDRALGELIYNVWKAGGTFDAWDDRFNAAIWHEIASQMNLSLQNMASDPRPVGSRQPWDVVHVGLADWWLVKEWDKAMAAAETAPCTENLCHACGVCTELDANHELAAPKEVVLGKNPFVKPLPPLQNEPHPSLEISAKPQAPNNKVVTRLRFQLTKLGDLRFISHLDLQHLLARAARRAGLSMAYSEGFNPAPRLSLAVSLPLFQEALAEVGEIDLSETIEPGEFVKRLNSQLPPEVQIIACRQVSVSNISLASLVGRAVYLCRPSGRQDISSETLSCRIDAVLAGKEIWLEGQARPGGKHKFSGKQEEKPKDIRPGIFALTLLPGPPAQIKAELACGPSQHVKPTDVLKLIDANLDWRVTRSGLATPEGISLFDLPDGLSGVLPAMPRDKKGVL